MEWFFVGRFESMGFGYNEYTNEDNTKCRQVWDDGYEEIFEISEKSLDKLNPLCYNKDTKEEEENNNAYIKIQ